MGSSSLAGDPMARASTAPRDIVVFLLQLMRAEGAAASDSSSVLHLAPRKKARHDPFTGALTSRVELRAELARQMRELPARERMLLFMWYVEEQPVTRIAQTLGLSRAHCYRLRDRALSVLSAGFRAGPAPAA